MMVALPQAKLSTESLQTIIVTVIIARSIITRTILTTAFIITTIKVVMITMLTQKIHTFFFFLHQNRQQKAGNSRADHKARFPKTEIPQNRPI